MTNDWVISRWLINWLIKPRETGTGTWERNAAVPGLFKDGCVRRPCDMQQIHGTHVLKWNWMYNCCAIKSNLTFSQIAKILCLKSCSSIVPTSSGKTSQSKNCIGFHHHSASFEFWWKLKSPRRRRIRGSYVTNSVRRHCLNALHGLMCSKCWVFRREACDSGRAILSKKGGEKQIAFESPRRRQRRTIGSEREPCCY